MDPEKLHEFFFTRFDENKDGKISADEAPERLKEHLSEMDKDGDGALSKEEFKPPRRPMRERLKEQKKEAPEEAAPAEESSEEQPAEPKEEPAESNV